MGGYYYPLSIVKYSLDPLNVTDIGYSVLTISINIISQVYVQHDNKLYFQEDYNLYSMDLSSTSTTINTVTSQTIPDHACLAAIPLEND